MKMQEGVDCILPNVEKLSLRACPTAPPHSLPKFLSRTIPLHPTLSHPVQGPKGFSKPLEHAGATLPPLLFLYFSPNLPILFASSGFHGLDTQAEALRAAISVLCAPSRHGAVSLRLPRGTTPSPLSPSFTRYNTTTRACFATMLFVHLATFCVNSLAHTFGGQNCDFESATLLCFPA